MSRPTQASRRASGELESDILAALWASPEPMSPADVRASLPGRLAYNTVHTSLTRLCEKGVVVRERTERGIGYRPAKDAYQHVADEMQAALARGSDRGAVLLRFVTSLDPDDEAALRAVLEQRAGG